MAEVRFASKLQNETVDFVLDRIGEVGGTALVSSFAQAISEIPVGSYFILLAGTADNPTDSDIRYQRTAGAPGYALTADQPASKNLTVQLSRNAASVGPLTEARAIAPNVADNTDLVRVSGAESSGKGVMDFVYDSAVDAAYVTSNPYTSFMDKDGRGYRLTADTVHARMFGVKDNDTTLGAYNATRIQAAIDWCSREFTSGRSNGMTVSFEGMGTVYHGQIFLKEGVFLFGGRFFGRGGGAGCCQLRPSGIPDGQFAINIIGTNPARIYNWGVDGFYIRGGGSGSNYGGIYANYASDGAINVLHMTNFGIQCIKLDSNTGVINIARVFTQGLFNSSVITAAAGSIELYGGDYTVSECEFSGPSQNTITSRNLYCAAARFNCNSSTFTACIFQTGDAGLNGAGYMSKFIGCRFDTNAGHGIYGISGGDLCTFSACVFYRNGASTPLASNAASFTASMSGTVMTVTAVSSGTLVVGDVVTPPGGTPSVINSFGTGTGAEGTYNMSVLQTVASTSMTSKLYFDQIFVPTSGTSMGRNTFVGTQFEVGSNPCRYLINDQRGVSAFRNSYLFNRFGTNAPTAGYFNVTGNNGPADIVPIAGGNQQLAVNSATPSVLSTSNFVTSNTAATTITNFTGGTPGHRLTILVNDNNTTFQHGSGINLIRRTGTVTPEPGTVMEFINRGGAWFQIGSNPRQLGWTAGTGTANLGAYATIAAATAPAAYDQTFTQGLRDGLVSVSQRVLALEQAMRAAGNIN